MQILRSIDKHDKIGTDGVVALLQKPETEFGAGLDPVRAALIGAFLNARGPDNAATLANLQAFFLHATRVNRRLQLLVAMDRGDGETALDRLLAMPPNANNTWENGGRPFNIAWALDDIADALDDIADAGLAE
jgi:hypothetical protein